ncbi:4-hydroxythreonine-4-phosphate dehydrogenase PdxA [SAR202 cluster bacterium AD-802-E10_MRT_200m]|nr:4-hydroxythreonine-4-phosphate dehydrogenase PdxA [SAR202 cluster bacterium AD-802-E10_MRT_200m]
MNIKPTVAVTMGDPCGIGPEVLAKALSNPTILQSCCPLVIGNITILKEALKNIGSLIELQLITGSSIPELNEHTIPILDSDNLDLNAITPGMISAIAGRASMEWVLQAAKLCIDGSVAAMVTSPINKEATQMAGYKDIGHQETLKRLTGALNVATMLISGTLRVVHLTTHKSLREACDAVTHVNVLEKILLTDKEFRRWGFDNPKIGVAALNPHASDGGLIGDEEETEIAPAVMEAKEEGIKVDGPIPADIVFHQAIEGKFDVILAMYHDQGHIPVKVYGFEQSISVNLGLPIIRTSVDHGTAFDIAGRGIANSLSMEEAILLASSLASGHAKLQSNL